VLGAGATLGATLMTTRHERAMERERRTQDRRGETYVALMAYVNWASLYAERRRAESVDPSAPIPPAPEDAGAIASRVLTYGAVSVITQLRKLVAALQTLDTAVVEGHDHTQAGRVPITETLSRAVDETIRVSDALRDTIRVDLGEGALPPGF